MRVRIKNSTYLANIDGTILTTNWKGSGQTVQIKPALDAKGYLRTMLTIGGKAKTVKMHRIIAEAFVPNPDKKPQVNHKNGIKTDNRAENLEWVTGSENMKHAVKSGLVKLPDPKLVKPKKGELNGGSILTEIQVLEIRNKFKPRVYTREMLASEYGVMPATIKDVVLRKSWKHI